MEDDWVNEQSKESQKKEPVSLARQVGDLDCFIIRIIVAGRDVTTGIDSHTTRRWIIRSVLCQYYIVYYLPSYLITWWIDPNSMTWRAF